MKRILFLLVTMCAIIAAQATPVYVVGNIADAGGISQHWNTSGNYGVLTETSTGSGIYTGTVTFDGDCTWRILTATGSNALANNTYGFDNDDATLRTNGTFNSGKNGNTKAPATGTYTVTFNMNNGAFALTTAASTSSDIYLRGENEGNWGTSDTYKFTKTSDANGVAVYSLENVTLNGEFKIATNDWDKLSIGSTSTSTVQNVSTGFEQTISANASSKNLNMVTSTLCSKITLTIRYTGNVISNASVTSTSLNVSTGNSSYFMHLWQDSNMGLGSADLYFESTSSSNFYTLSVPTGFTVGSNSAFGVSNSSKDYHKNATCSANVWAALGYAGEVGNDATLAAGTYYGATLYVNGNDWYIYFSSNINGGATTSTAPTVTPTLYLQGEVNSWSAVDAYKLTKMSDNGSTATFQLKNVPITGLFQIADNGFNLKLGPTTSGNVTITSGTTYQLNKAGENDRLNLESVVYGTLSLTVPYSNGSMTSANITNGEPTLLITQTDPVSSLTSTALDSKEGICSFDVNGNVTTTSTWLSRRFRVTFPQTEFSWSTATPSGYTDNYSILINGTTLTGTTTVNGTVTVDVYGVYGATEATVTNDYVNNSDATKTFTSSQIITGINYKTGGNNITGMAAAPHFDKNFSGGSLYATIEAADGGNAAKGERASWYELLRHDDGAKTTTVGDYTTPLQQYKNITQSDWVKSLEPKFDDVIHSGRGTGTITTEEAKTYSYAIIPHFKMVKLPVLSGNISTYVDDNGYLLPTITANTPALQMQSSSKIKSVANETAWIDKYVEDIKVESITDGSNNADFTLTAGSNTPTGIDGVTADEISVTGGDGIITVTGASSAAVFDITGRLIESTSKNVIELPAGLYIVRTGNVTTKVRVK